MISSVAFDNAWEFRVMCCWLRKRDGHRISKKVVSHLRPSSSVSGLPPSHGKSWTNWFSIWGQILIWRTVSSSLLTLLCCALKLSLIACHWVIYSQCPLFPLSYQYSRQCHLQLLRTSHIPYSSPFWVILTLSPGLALSCPLSKLKRRREQQIFTIFLVFYRTCL